LNEDGAAMRRVVVIILRERNLCIIQNTVLITASGLLGKKPLV